MGRHLFFEGPPRIGKSTCLRNEINSRRMKICGYTVQRVFCDGQIIGYQAVVVRGLPLPQVDIEFYRGMPGLFLFGGESDISVLEQAVSEVESIIAGNAVDCVLFDEIGGVELASEAFMQPLLRILTSDVPCIGILKSIDNLANTAKMFKQQSAIMELHDMLTKTILKRGEIITVTQANIDNISHFLNK